MIGEEVVSLQEAIERVREWLRWQEGANYRLRDAIEQVVSALEARLEDEQREMNIKD